MVMNFLRYKLWKYFSCFCLICLKYYAINGNCWLDQSHMLIGAVATLSMNPADVKRIEDILGLWKADFPRARSISTASVWLDHIACDRYSPLCSGYLYQDAFKMTKKWHFESLIYNPQKMKIEGVAQFFPLPDYGAVYALNSAFKALAETTLTGNCVISNAMQCEREVGSPFSLNMHLRLFMHIYEDIHLPVHAVEMFAEGFPEGDHGANLISVRPPKKYARGRVSNLHYLWDSAGFLYYKKFAHVDATELHQHAVELMKRYPVEHFGDLLDKKYIADFEYLVNESHQLARSAVYSEIDFKTFSKKSLPYYPTSPYIEKVQKVCQERIVLAGYRLGRLLTYISNFLPSMSYAAALKSDRYHKLAAEDL